MRRLGLALALTLGLAPMAQAQEEGARPGWASQDGIEAMRGDILADLPPGFDIKGRTIGPDFMVFAISKGDQGYVGVYHGANPNFPIEKAATVIDGERPTASYTRSDGTTAHEYLVASSRTERPYVLHVWTMEVPAAEAPVAAAIAASVRAR